MLRQLGARRSHRARVLVAEWAVHHRVCPCTPHANVTEPAAAEITPFFSLKTLHTSSCIRLPVPGDWRSLIPGPPAKATTADSTAFSLVGRSVSTSEASEHSFVVWEAATSEASEHSFVVWEAARQRSHILAACAFPVIHRENRDGLIRDHVRFPRTVPTCCSLAAVGRVIPYPGKPCEVLTRTDDSHHIC